MLAEQPGKGAVLVVEDDDDQRELIATILRDNGYPVYLARNGFEALARLADAPGLRLILVDLHMPVMDGRTFIKQLHTTIGAKGLSVAVHSSDDFDPPSGIVEFLKKPAEYRALVELVQKYCD